MKKLFPCLTRPNVPLFVALLIAPLLPAPTTFAQRQRREFLTPQEFEMVADARELESRIKVFIKIAERRLLVIINPQAAQTEQAKETDTWGDLPKGTRADTLNDLANLLAEAVTNIDDAFERNNGSPQVPKATRKLAAAATRFLPQLTPLRESATGDGEREALEQVIDKLQEILDAAKKVPEEKTGKTEKTGKKDN